MQAILIKKNYITKYLIPIKMSGNFWIKDFDRSDVERNLISLSIEGNKTTIYSNESTSIINGKETLESATLELYDHVFIKAKNETEFFLIYILPDFDNTFTQYQTKVIGDFMVGSASSCQIKINSPLISERQAILRFKGETWEIEDLKSKTGIYVNGKRVLKKSLINGDVIFLACFKIIIFKNTLYINNYNNSLNMDSKYFTLIEPKPETLEDFTTKQTDESIELYEERDYYFASPRFLTSIETEKVVIDSPPQMEKQEDMPMIYTMGPMLTMGVTSVVTAYVAINNVNQNGLPLSSAMPTLIMSGAMLTTMIFWPFVMKIYQKRQKKKREKERQGRYSDYLKEKRKKIEQIKSNQRQIMMENFPPMADVQTTILMRKRSLWERKVDHKDFCVFRLGTGNIPLKIDLQYSEEHFTMDDDNLREELKNLVKNSEEVSVAPVTLSLVEKNNLVIIGQERFQKDLIRNMILQLTAFHSYEDLRIVLMLENDDDEIWEAFKVLPHIWNDEKDLRFFASNHEEMVKVSFYLETELNSRKNTEENKNQNFTYKKDLPFYVIVCNNIKKTRNIGIINEILNDKRNFGFSVVILNDGINNLPKECSNFIALEEEKSAIMENDLNPDKQQIFKLDTESEIDFYRCAGRLANIPITYTRQNSSLPSNFSFLTMYNVGKVEQLNVIDRWYRSNSTNSLSAPIGVHKDGELFNLDLHEKYYGPHGLIAGMTGSGKSEFIITYILSMAINYHPNDVSFVLIDYKGGGLTGALENKDLGIKLPHLAGTITNLETIELKRSLVSIESELRRRQTLFNKAREQLSESSIDIYKYQKLYKDGLIQEPISHLFIISDEFAELKQQQPEFMDKLISTARIGRSLGVHLILATQKPGGIVNDQIWSNSKFRVCLKVQEKSDSMDVIKRPDAASLKNPGRFYLQVGYNDFFGLGQSAWAGEQYYPTDKIRKKIDTSLSFIDNLGNNVKSLDDIKKSELVSKGEELTNIVKYLSDMAFSEKIKIPQLWLEAIPEEIFVSNLKQKYNVTSEEYVINPIIGEYDDPNNQRQDVLTLNLTDYGNTIVYGVSGSGKELALSTIIYSTITEHSAREVNFYILDFGAETLKVFSKSPHVGDVILSSEAEKVKNTFKFLIEEMRRRKTLMADSTGDFKHFVKNTKEDLPLIVVVINNYEGFAELYENEIDTLISLSREGARYGITFVISTSGTNSLRYRLTQNFSQHLVLQFNDTSDYMSILGNVRGMVPSSYYGRGLTKINNQVHEFQTAYPTKKEDMSDFLREVSEGLSINNDTKAEGIKVLPEKVTFDIIKGEISDIRNTPLGMNKETLRIEKYDFASRFMTFISANDSIAFERFIPSLASLFALDNSISTIVIDPNSLMSKLKIENITYISDNFVENISNLKNTIESTQNKKIMCIITSISELRSKLGENNTLIDDLIFEYQTKSKMNVVIVDSIDKLKTIEYEEKYKSAFTNNFGIWLGMGISDQFFFKVNNSTQYYKDKSTSEFGFIIERGEVKHTKLIDFTSKD